VWPATLYALWLLMTGSLDRTELVMGAAVSAAGAGVARLVGRGAPPLGAPSRRSLQALPSVPWRMVADTGILAAALVRVLRGRRSGFRRHRVGAPEADSPVDQAVTIWAASLPSATFVISAEGGGETMVHGARSP
jgi:hypothetical protein